jgi:histidine triad (HIT) family protein
VKTSTKLLIVAIAVVTIIVGYPWYNSSITNEPCPFCDPKVLAINTFYEDDLVIGLCTHKPVEQGHCLVITKRHIEQFEETTEEEVVAIGRLMKKINQAVQKVHGPSSYLILQKNGLEVGQSVPHIHFHYIPKQKSTNGKMAFLSLVWHFFTAPIKNPLSPEKIKINANQIRLGLTA